MSMTYRGEVEIVERDDAAHRAVMKARKAKEARGQGTAERRRRRCRWPANGGATAGHDRRPTSQLSGKAAAMGQGVIQDVSARLVETFADNLAEMLAAPAAGAEAEAAPAGGGNGGASAEAPTAATAGARRQRARGAPDRRQRSARAATRPSGGSRPRGRSRVHPAAKAGKSLGVKLEQSFEVDAPIGAVWAALIDVERVAPCLPGAEVTEVGADGTYRGTFRVKLGPTTARLSRRR